VPLRGRARARVRAVARALGFDILCFVKSDPSLTLHYYYYYYYYYYEMMKMKMMKMTKRMKKPWQDFSNTAQTPIQMSPLCPVALSSAQTERRSGLRLRRPCLCGHSESSLQRRSGGICGVVGSDVFLRVHGRGGLLLCWWYYYWYYFLEFLVMMIMMVVVVVWSLERILAWQVHELIYSKRVLDNSTLDFKFFFQKRE
jgi:hypothetical protein